MGIRGLKKRGLSVQVVNGDETMSKLWPFSLRTILLLLRSLRHGFDSAPRVSGSAF